MVCISSRREGELDNLRGMVEKDHCYYGHCDQSHFIISTNSSDRDKTRKILNYRETVCEWYYAIVDRFNISREIVYISMSYLDRYSRKKDSFQVIPTSEYRLAAITSLYLAIKLNQQRIINISSFIHLSKGLVTKSQIITMEQTLLSNSDWLVHPPTPQVFSSLYFSLLRSSVFLSNDPDAVCIEFSTYLIELSVLYPSFVGLPAYAVAIAALCVSVSYRLKKSLEKNDDIFESINKDLREIVTLPDKADEYINTAYENFRKLTLSTDKINNDLMDIFNDKGKEGKIKTLEAKNNEPAQSPTCMSSMNSYSNRENSYTNGDEHFQPKQEASTSSCEIISEMEHKNKRKR